MSITRVVASALLSAALFAPAMIAFAQSQSPSADAAKAEPLEATPFPDSAGGTNQAAVPKAHVGTALDRMRIDPFKAQIGWLFPREGSNDHAIALDPGTGGFCYFIRSYVVARDDAHSDSTHLVRSSTCQPAGRFHVHTADLTVVPAAR